MKNQRNLNNGLLSCLFGSEKKNEESNKKITNIIYISIIVCFFCIHLFFAYHHEAWRDEAQCWVLSKNLSLKELLMVLPSEGHPILWFLVLKVLLFFKLPFRYLCVFTTVLITISLALLLYKVNMPLAVKIFTAISSLFFYQNSIVSRSYSLIVFLIVLLLIYWNSRYNHPVIVGILAALLIQTHVIFIGMGCGILFIYVVKAIIDKFDHKKLIIPVGIILLSLFALPFELFQTYETNTAVRVSKTAMLSKINIYTVREMLKSMANCLLEADSLIIIYLLMILIGFIIFIIFTSFIASIFLKKADLFDASAVALATLGEGMIVVGFIYAGVNQMRFTWFLSTILFFYCGINKSLKGYWKYICIAGMVFVLSISSINNFENAIKDVKDPYISDSLPFATFVKDNIPENSVILVSEAFAVSPSYSYISDMRPDIEVFSVDKKISYFYHIWGYDYKQMSIEEWNSIVNLFDSDKNLYYWNCNFSPTAPDEVMNKNNLLYDNLSKGIEEGNQLYLIR